jgi:phosphoribosylglycinamide formyltransferase 1
MASQKKRVAILISGRGSNMVSLVEAARAADYPAEPVVVISNRPDAPGLGWAKAQGLNPVAFDHKRYDSRVHFESDLQTALEAAETDLICLAGFMRLMTPDFVAAWHNRMLNIHPALLPAFKGLHTHERALSAGVRFAGCTVHLVRAEMDEGPILGQAAVPVLQGDTAATLASRVLQAEHRLYPHILRLYASGQIRVENEIVKYSDGKTPAVTLFSPEI